jgi:hypothetical protein
LVATADSLRKTVVVAAKGQSQGAAASAASADSSAQSGKHEAAAESLASADVVDLRSLYQHRLRIVHASMGSVQLTRYFQGM